MLSKAAAKTRLIVLGFVLGAGAVFALTRAQKPASSLGGPVGDFRLLDASGKSHRLSYYSYAKAVVLVSQGNSCPISGQSMPALLRLRDRFAGDGVVFFLINANPQDDRDSIAAEARKFGVDIPVLKDETQLVTESLGITRTAEALVIDPAGWRIVYRGPIDDQLGYGTRKPKPEHEYLFDAISATLKGRRAPIPSAEARGCLIRFDGRGKEGGLTYVRDAAPILRRRCVSCHTRGESSWPMGGYAAVKGWSAMIRETVLAGRMPPWKADPRFGEFENDGALSAEETRTLVRWIDAGALRGEGPDPLAAAALEPPAEEWPLGKPDLVLSPGEQAVAASGGSDDLREVEVASPLSEDAWVRAVDFRPSNKKVTHHGLIFLRYPKGAGKREPNWAGGANAYFAVYVPGREAAPSPGGTAQWLPKGSRFVFSMHYVKTGKAEADRPRLALYLYKGKPPRELKVTSATGKMNIPPGVSDYRLIRRRRFDREVLLHAMMPHMHGRGRSMSFTARYPDGRIETLLSVPDYEFGWQMEYRLARPKRLPAGTEVICRGSYDNSSRNPANPDPTAWAAFDAKTSGEMFIGYLIYSEPADPSAPPRVL